MTRKTQWPDDPVVREVRQARAKLWKEAGGTIEGLMELVHSRAAQLRDKTRAKKSRGRTRRPSER